MSLHGGQNGHRDVNRGRHIVQCVDDHSEQRVRTDVIYYVDINDGTEHANDPVPAGCGGGATPAPESFEECARRHGWWKTKAEGCHVHHYSDYGR